MTNDRWTIETPDGSFHAHIARPEGEGPWPVVIAIQEIFGINDVMRQVCATLAGHGFLAVAPDLFWRLEPGIELTDRTRAEWDKALGYMNRFDVDKGVEDIAATIRHARSHGSSTGKVGAVGYCLGGKLAFLTATRTEADGAVGYYGVGLEALVGEAEKLTKPLMLHIAGQDSFSSDDARAVVIGALKDHPLVTVHVYEERDHAFARPGGEHYHAADAKLADERTVAFLKSALA